MRLERTVLSDANPLMKPVEALAEKVRAERQPVSPDNPFLAVERFMADSVEQSWNMFRDVRDAWQEATFYAIYGSPFMRAIGAESLAQRAAVKSENLLNLPDVKAALEQIEEGGEAAAIVRMLELLSSARGYVRRSRLEKELQVFESEKPLSELGHDERAKLIHSQALVVQFAPERAKESLPKLLDTAEKAAHALELVMRVAGPEETMHPGALALYREFEAMLSREEPKLRPKKRASA
jgi:hypothetical protein